MLLLDTNIVIYAYQAEFSYLLDYIENNESIVSRVSYIEALGYHKLSENELLFLEKFFAEIEILPITENIAIKAMQLRQQHKMSLGDSLIAATALIHDLILATRNIDDFNWINDLKLVNPIDENFEHDFQNGYD